MQKYTMTVHEGLAELKILASRIEKELASNAFVACNKHANTKIEGVTIKEYSEKLKSAMQKVSDLIARRNAIKKAITKSNAVTEVTLTKENGEKVTMTVAELIEFRNVGIMFTEKFANTLAQQYNAAVRNITRVNDDIGRKADEYVVGLFGNKEGVSSDVIESTRNSYIEANTVDMIDPSNVLDKINSMKEEIDFYNTKVDAALSTSNAVTIIEFEC